MFKILLFKKQLLYLIIVSICFQICYGFQIIVPTNINWLMSAYHDWGQHYLGWAYYRQEPWTFPLGDIKNFYYPVGTNVGFTDSIPLFALFFKIFKDFLPENFQYLGLWLFLCHFFISYYTIKICEHFNVSYFFKIIAVILLTLNPVLVFRGLHPALCSHFLILASFYNYIKVSTQLNSDKINYNQVVIFFIAITINPYIALMIAGFNIILPIKNYLFDRSISFKKLIYFPIISFGSGLLFWIVFGMINLKESNTTNLAAVENFRLFSFNLNSFFNSYGYFSKILPDLGMVNDKQYEGFGYFGVGMLLLLLLLLIYLLFTYKTIPVFKIKSKYYPLLILCLGLFIFSMSNQISFGKKILFEYPIPNSIERLGFIFRASGRFVWPFYYLVFIFSLIIFTKSRVNNNIKLGLILIITLLQIYDTQNLLTKNNFKNVVYHTKLSDEKLIPIFKNFDQIITYPCFNTSLMYHLDYQDFCFLALKAKKPITNGYVARDNPKETQKYKDTLVSKLNRGEIKNQLFITTTENLEDFTVLLNSNKVSIKTLDNFVYIFSSQKKLDHYFNSTIEEELKLKQLIENLKSQDNYVIDNYQPIETNSIQYNFDSFIFNNSVLRINGWACLKTTKNASEENTFMVIFNDKSTLKVPVKIVKRPDVTKALTKGNLDDSGFKTIIFTNVLDKGTYNLGILIIDKNGNMNYTKTDKKLQITDYKKPLKIVKKNLNTFVSAIESLNLENFFPIKSENNSGLVFLENTTTKSEKIYLKKGNYKIIIEGISYPDKPLKGINAHFNIKNKGQKIGEFYLNENSKKPNPNVSLSLKNNQEIQLEFSFDNDVMIDKIDRNARINKVKILPN